ncbi:MAG TPA: hypothetical protein VK879_15370, partial [Candidatus Sulfomarinibacteraceae bacterium]|nr:hypothetical protein [Candidatus Sulfomarinibacteraceae bacterium]
MSQPSEMFLLWVGSAALGLAWGWLLGLWTAPAGRPHHLARSLRPLLICLPHVARAWLARAGTNVRWAALRRVLRPGLLLVLALAPPAEAWAYGGAGPGILVGAATGAGWWLQRAWREQLARRAGRGAPGATNEAETEH